MSGWYHFIRLIGLVGWLIASSTAPLPKSLQETCLDKEARADTLSTGRALFMNLTDVPIRLVLKLIRRIGKMEREPALMLRNMVLPLMGIMAIPTVIALCVFEGKSLGIGSMVRGWSFRGRATTGVTFLKRNSIGMKKADCI